MRRWIPLMVLLSLGPVGATAQTWSPLPESYIVGNTVVPGPQWVASGKGRGSGHGGGAPSPSPSPAPSPSSAQSFSGEPGRGESGFSFPTFRVQTEAPPVAAPLPPELPPITVQPIPPGPVGAPYATLTIPVQLLQGANLPSAVPPPYATTQPLPRGPRDCPSGCAEATPTPHPQLYVPARSRLCNTLGQCILWP